MEVGTQLCSTIIIKSGLFVQLAECSRNGVQLLRLCHKWLASVLLFWRPSLGEAGYHEDQPVAQWRSLCEVAPPTNNFTSLISEQPENWIVQPKWSLQMTLALDDTDLQPQESPSCSTKLFWIWRNTKIKDPWCFKFCCSNLSELNTSFVCI